MPRPDGHRPCPCRCATRAICPSPDDGNQCGCNPYRRGRGHKGSDALLEQAQARIQSTFRREGRAPVPETGRQTAPIKSA